MSSVFSGALQPKKKGDLQELASALKISSDGTKDELYIRLKKHLDKHQMELESDPQFSGLFDRRRKRKESVPPPSKRSTVDSAADTRSSTSRRVVSMAPVFESTPVKDLSDVSAFLKNPPETTPYKQRALAITDTPSSLPPLPLSPETSILDRSFIQRSLVPTGRVDGLAIILKQRQEAAVRSINQVVFHTRAYLSNSRTIWFGSILVQLIYIYVTIVPWQHLSIPLSATSAPGASGIPSSTVVPKTTGRSWIIASVTIPYPPLASFKSPMFWTILIHWFIPTVLVPTIVGIFINFKPMAVAPAPALRVALSESREISRIIHEEEDGDEERATPAQPEKPQLMVPFDPLTAAIARLAAEIAYIFPNHAPFSLMSNASPTIESVDVLGFKWRTISAGVGLAFAFAEAISGGGLSSRGVEFHSPTTKRLLRQHETVNIVDSQSEVD